MKHDQFEPWDSGTYRTGSTTPPKAHSRLVSILLILVIILSGLVSILSVMNIRLFSAFQANQQPEEVPLSLEIGHYPEKDLIPGDADAITVSGNKSIGIVGDLVTPVYQKHFHLPEGLFITHVVEGSTAEQQGIQEGDVLISLGNILINEEDSLKSVLDAMEPGDECSALIYRLDTDEHLHLTLKIQQIEP